MNESQTQFKTGQLVRVNDSFCHSENLGFIYEEYPDYNNADHNGVSIILKDGKNLGGFSFKEQQLYLELVADTSIKYHFRDVSKLIEDYKLGVFQKIFESAS